MNWASDKENTMSWCMRRRAGLAFLALLSVLLAWPGVAGRARLTAAEPQEGMPYFDKFGEARIEGEPPPPQHVSLHQLIVAPDTFHEKRIVTQGFLVLSFEHTAIYISREDALAGLTYNGLWVDTFHRREQDRSDQPRGSDGQEPKLRDAHMKYVTVEATFDRHRFGHLHSRYGGTLDRVALQEIHRERKDFPPMRWIWKGGTESEEKGKKDVTPKTPIRSGKE